MSRKNTEEDFWKLTKLLEDGCIVWTRRRDACGYGLYYFGRPSPYRAHRLAWQFKNGAIPDNLLVCHKCDNTRCVNSDHLFLGTDADNTADKINKGRHLKGEQISSSRLTERDIKNIRLLYLLIDSIKIKDFFGLDSGNLSRIVNRKTWNHVPDYSIQEAATAYQIYKGKI